MASRNFERYKKWYKRGAITVEMLDQMVKVGLLTAEQAEEIKNGDNNTIKVNE